MGLEYNLAEITRLEDNKELRLDVAPRNQCRHYVKENGGIAELLSREEFNSNYREGNFVHGPFREILGDSYGDPYNPNRQAFGILKSGKIVYCELSESFQEKVKKLLEKTKPS